MIRVACVVASIASLVSGCGRDHTADTGSDKVAATKPRTSGALGTERQDCRAGGICDPGLLCLSNLCVRPPAADCKEVGETLASFELGNYAEPDERAPVVARHAEACTKAHVTKDEGKCILESRDKHTAEACAPAMFPKTEQPIADAGSCVAVGEVFRRVMGAQATEPSIQAIVDRSIGAIVQSCKEDKWPVALIECMTRKEALVNQDLLRECNEQMTPDLQAKLTKRLQDSMQGL